MSEETAKKGGKGKGPKGESKKAAKAEAAGGDAAAAAPKKEKKEKAGKGAAKKEEKEESTEVDVAAEAKAEADNDAAQAAEVAADDAKAEADDTTGGEEANGNGDEESEEKAGKGKAKKEKAPPTKPDFQDHQHKMNNFQKELKEAEESLRRLNSEIEAKQIERAKARQDKKDQADRLNDLKKRTTDLFNQAAALQAQIAREEATTLSKNPREQKVNVDLQAIDARLNELARLPPAKTAAQGNAIRGEQQSLTKQRDALRLERDRIAATVTLDTAPLRTERQLKTDEANEKKEEQKEAAKAFNQARKRELQINDKIDQLIKKRKQLQNDRNVKKQALTSHKSMYDKKEKEYNNWLKQQQRAQREEKENAKEKKEKAKKAYEAATATPSKDEDKDEDEKKPEEPKHPFATELGMVDLLTRYLKSQLPKGAEEGDKKAEEKSQADIVAARNAKFKGTPKSVKVNVSKKGKYEAYFADVIAPAPAKKEKAAAPDPMAKKIQLIPDLFIMFEALLLPPPLTVGDVPETLKALQSKRDAWENGTTEDRSKYDAELAASRNAATATAKALADQEEAKKKEAKAKKKAAAKKEAEKAAEKEEKKPAKKEVAAPKAKETPKKGKGSKKAPEPQPEPEPTEEAATEEAAAATEEASATTEEAAPAAAEEETKAEETKATEEPAAAESSPTAATSPSAASPAASPSAKKGKKKGSKAK